MNLAAAAALTALAAQASPVFGEQLIARWTVRAPGHDALVDVDDGGTVLAASGTRLTVYEPSTGAVLHELKLPCAARAVERGYLLCARALYRVKGGAVEELATFASDGTALAVHMGIVAVALEDGVHVRIGVDTRVLSLAEGKRIEALAFGPAGARLYAIGEGTIYVGPVDEGLQPEAPTARRLVLDRSGAKSGTADGPFRARFGGATLSERAGIPRLSLAASQLIVDLKGDQRVASVAARKGHLVVSEAAELRYYGAASFGEEPPPPPPDPVRIDWPSAAMIGASALIFAGTPAVAGLLHGSEVLPSLAIAGVAVLGSAAAVYGVIGLVYGSALLFESTRPYKPIKAGGDPLSGILNSCGRSCWEVAQIFLCLTGATLVLGGAALLGASPFLYMLFDPAAGIGDAQLDFTILAASGAGAGAGLATWLLGFLPPTDDDELVEAREIPREVLAVAVGSIVATGTWAILRSNNPR